MQDFPANSNKARTEQPREPLQRVTSAEPVRRKRGLGRKFKEVFIAGDAHSVFDYVFLGVIIPALKDMLSEAWGEAGQRLIHGESNRPRSGHHLPWSSSSAGRVDYPPHTPYSRMSTSAVKSPPQRMLSRGSRARHNFDELIIPTVQEANEVIERLFDVLSRYGEVSVADLYELTGIQSSHTDMKWGWTNLQGAKALRLRQGGFLLDLPEPKAL